MREEAQTITSLVEGVGIFESTGVSTIKMSRGGVVHPKKIPIKSVDLETVKRESGRPPKPPTVEKDGKLVFDETADEYIEALNDYNADFGWRMVIAGVNIEWEMADRRKAKSFEDKKRILMSSGITGPQFDQLYKDIMALTTFLDEQADLA